jgi:PAS domain-containing protein
MEPPELLAATIAALPMAAVALDRNGVVLACNGLAEASLGCGRDAAGQPFR